VKNRYQTVIVGAGKITTDQHLPALARSERFDAVAIVDPRPVDTVIPRFATIDELLARLQIDAVVIATPPQVREELALTALRAGCHVMLEKPPSLTSAGAQRLDAQCSPGQSLFAAWHSREAAMVSRAAAWLKDRTVASGRVVWHEDAHVWHPGQLWLWAPGGFGVFDPAINAISILITILPMPVATSKALFEVPVNQELPIGAAVELVSGGARIILDLNFRAQGAPRWTIELATTDGGRLELSDGGRILQLDDEPQQVGMDAEYDGLYRRFAALIDTGTSDVDTRPLDIVADAFRVARHVSVPEFQP